MKDCERYLLLGVYAPPQVRQGDVLACQYLGADVVCTGGYTDGLIRWPLARERGRGGRAGPVVCGGLAEAVRRESCQAVARWFGVSRCLVSDWRAALRVPTTNAGTGRLRVEYMREPWAVAAREVARRSLPCRRWPPEEDELVRVLRPAEAAGRVGRTLEAVRSRRRVLRRQGKVVVVPLTPAAATAAQSPPAPAP